MMSFVIDASVALAWCFSDETTPASLKLLDRLDAEIAYVPELWTLEVGNILTMSCRKKRITYAKMTEFIVLLGNLNIQIDNETSQRGFREILALAHAEGLTTYDASYLELAMRQGVHLATKDKQLINVAKKLGVSIISLNNS